MKLPLFRAGFVTAGLALVALTSFPHAGGTFEDVGNFFFRPRFFRVPLAAQNATPPSALFPVAAPGFEFPADLDFVADLSDATEISGLFEYISEEAAFGKLANGRYGLISDEVIRYVGIDPIPGAEVVVGFDYIQLVGGGPTFQPQTVPSDDADFAMIEIINGGGTFDGIPAPIGLLREDTPFDSSSDSFGDRPLRAYRYPQVGTLQQNDEFEAAWCFDMGVDIDGIMGAFAEATDLDDQEQVVLNPGGTGGDPALETFIAFTNESGTDGAEVSVLETEIDLHPEVLGFGLFTTSLTVETTLPDGEYFLTVTIPFSSADLGGADPRLLELAYFDEVSGAWELAVSGNTQPSPGHAGPVGDPFLDEAAATPVPPVPSTDLGDYGVFWNDTDDIGFVWANVDHTTEFGGGIRGIEAYGCGVNPLGSLAHTAGTPVLGEVLTLRLDNPVTPATGGAGVLLASLVPDANFPCGIHLPGFGMSVTFGELLIGVLPPNPVATLGPVPWLGPTAGAEVSVPIPNDAALDGLVLFFQGVLSSPSPAALTSGVLVVLRSP